jgi:hypothetical protein
MRKFSKYSKYFKHLKDIDPMDSGNVRNPFLSTIYILFRWVYLWIVGLFIETLSFFLLIICGLVCMILHFKDDINWN